MSTGEGLAVERILFFSDAVFAIAITLLVIEIRVPVVEGGDRELALALLRMLPQIVGFVISFFLIGQTWAEHHRIGRQLTGWHRSLLWRNLVLLFFVAAMPFVTGLLSEYFQSRLAVVVYAGVFASMGLAKAFMWRAAVRHRLVDRDSSEAWQIGRRVWAVPLTAALVTLAAAVGVPYAFAGFALIPVAAAVLGRGDDAARRSRS